MEDGCSFCTIRSFYYVTAIEVSSWAENLVDKLTAKILLDQQIDGVAFVLLFSSPAVYMHLKDIGINKAAALKLTNAAQKLLYIDGILVDEWMLNNYVLTSPENIEDDNRNKNFVLNKRVMEQILTKCPRQHLVVRKVTPPLRKIPKQLPRQHQIGRKIKPQQRKVPKHTTRPHYQYTRKESPFEPKISNNGAGVFGPQSSGCDSKIKLHHEVRDATSDEIEYFFQKKITPLSKLKKY